MSEREAERAAVLAEAVGSGCAEVAVWQVKRLVHIYRDRGGQGVAALHSK